MIYAQISSVNHTIIRYPLNENDLRALFTSISLPLELTKLNLPENYVIVFDKNRNTIPSILLPLISKIEPSFDNENKQWFINKEVEEFTSVIETPIPELPKFLISRLKELAVYTEKVANDVTSLYKIPSVESQTWDMQFTEALAWSKDNTVATPTLDMIAISRGISKTVLKEKALEKAVAYQLIISFIVGKKQYYEDLLSNATTIDEIRNISFNIDVSEIPELLKKETILPTL